MLCETPFLVPRSDLKVALLARKLPLASSSLPCCSCPFLAHRDTRLALTMSSLGNGKIDRATEMGAIPTCRDLADSGTTGLGKRRGKADAQSGSVLHSQPASASGLSPVRWTVAAKLNQGSGRLGHRDTLAN